MERKVIEYTKRHRNSTTEHKLDINVVNIHYERNNQDIIFTCETIAKCSTERERKCLQVDKVVLLVITAKSAK